MHDKFESHIDCGPDGLLYDRRVREYLTESPRDEVLAGEALTALRLAGHAFRTQMDRWLERHGLSEGRLHVLIRLARIGDLTLGDLAESIDVSPRNVTGLVDHLENDGLVERTPDPEDRRAMRVRISPAGEALLGEIRSQKTIASDRLVAGFTEEELKQLRHLLLKLVQNLSAEPAKEMKTV